MPKRRTVGRASVVSRNDAPRNAERLGTIETATGSLSWNGSGAIGNQPSPSPSVNVTAKGATGNSPRNLPNTS